MKVGTDGVLLGAWSSPRILPNMILDIGSGSGLIAIMMAQRFINAKIEAIEIDKEASIEAQQNMKSSKWASRLKCFNCSLQDFNSPNLYDFIVCNPPFFSNTTISKNKSRQLARHNHSLGLIDLLMYSKNLLTSKGEMAIIMPSTEFELLAIEANKNNMYIVDVCWVRGTEKSPYKRVMLKLSKVQQPLVEQFLTLEKKRHEYSQEYIKLCKDFYLKF